MDRQDKKAKLLFFFMSFILFILFIYMNIFLGSMFFILAKR